MYAVVFYLFQAHHTKGPIDAATVPFGSELLSLQLPHVKPRDEPVPIHLGQDHLQFGLHVSLERRSAQ